MVDFKKMTEFIKNQHCQIQQQKQESRWRILAPKTYCNWHSSCSGLNRARQRWRKVYPVLADALTTGRWKASGVFQNPKWITLHWSLSENTKRLYYFDKMQIEAEKPNDTSRNPTIFHGKKATKIDIVFSTTGRKLPGNGSREYRMEDKQ